VYLHDTPALLYFGGEIYANWLYRYTDVTGTVRRNPQHISGKGFIFPLPTFFEINNFITINRVTVLFFTTFFGIEPVNKK
jgi:hypothetical protein